MVRDNGTIIVGLGASAGGIEAFHSFFAAVPRQDRLAFLVVLHLSPERASMLTEILQNWTEMPVHQAEDGAIPQAGHVYVIPPNTILTVRHGALRVEPATEPRHPSAAINALFASLATELGENAIGIVLSGTGSDGALGLKAIKACGGLTLAQGTDGTSPQFEGMPASAIAAGSVDLVLPVQAMPARILSIIETTKDTPAPADTELLAQSFRTEVCTVLREAVGHDFSQYKEPTFVRRLQRRMNVTGLSGQAYLDALRADRDEAMLLFRDLLIGVTSFFRDSATFKVVEDQVLPRLFAGKTSKDRLRVWVPGCSTGEEAYSLAMMLVEYMDHVSDPPEVQLFATDIDAPAISIARLGRYPEILLHDMPADRLRRFFTRSDDTYVVSKEVRGYCTFSAHSIIRDPPFSRIDLISCRNLLIYLDIDLQAKVIPAFHYALATDGLLLLGASESVARHTDLFEPLDRRHRIYMRRPVPSPPMQLAVLGGDREAAPGRATVARETAPDRQDALSLANRRIRDRFSPAFAVVTGTGEAMHFSPRTGKYLEIAAGSPTANVIAQARTGLRLELRAALRRAVETGAAVERENVVVQFDGGAQSIVLTIEPLPNAHGERLYLVVFADGERPAGEDASTEAPRPLLQDLTIEQLERELRDMREENQSIAEQYETALAELKSANEELHSVNEELQSSNEELETSKEEIQSVNEELQTVNHQLTQKVDELDRASSDLRNLFESTRVPTLFLDRKLTLRSFTPAASNVYNLIAADLGRPLTDIVSALRYDSLREDVAHVLATLEPLEKRVERRDGQAHYLMHVLPYRSSDNAIEGVLVTFIDVTTMVVAEQHDRLLVDELNHRVKNMLTVVLSLASQTRRGAVSFATFWDAFMGRLRALATAYELLTRDHWTDIPLRDVLREELSPYMTPEQNNIMLIGPHLFLRPKGALAFGMVVHELATNALKYGGLSAPEGRVTVTWNVEEAAEPGHETLQWIWQESGGPPVSQPERHSFGLSLIERSLSHEMNAKATMDFRPSGLEVSVRVPFDPLILARQSSRLLQA